MVAASPRIALTPIIIELSDSFLYKDVRWAVSSRQICILLTAYCQQLTIIGELYKKGVLGRFQILCAPSNTPHS